MAPVLFRTSSVSWVSLRHNGGAELGGKAEEPAEAAEDPAVEASVHQRQQPARAAAYSGWPSLQCCTVTPGWEHITPRNQGRTIVSS